MNCKHVQELLPLYVGRDLEEKRAQLVTAHLQSCAECAGAADEYRGSRQLLQRFAPPAFSEGAYAGIRQRVLREITQESNAAPALPNFVASLFRPRLNWAMATALLLAVSGFTFYFINQRNAEQQAKSPARGSELTASPSPASTPNNGPPSMSSGAGAGTTIVNNSGTGSAPNSVGIRGSDRTNQPQRRKPPRAAVNLPDPGSMAAQVSPQDNNIAELNTVLAGNPAATEKTLRMEMQTSDRNIRIIWFYPQPTKQDSPKESSRGI